MGGNRKLGAMFRAKAPKGIAEANVSARTAQLQTISVVLSVIAYRKRNFGAMDVPSAFLRSEHL